MYYRSGTVVRQMLRFHSTGGSTFLAEMTSWQPFWNHDVKSKIRLCQSMRIYMENIDPIWNDGALGFLKDIEPTRTTRT